VVSFKQTMMRMGVLGILGGFLGFAPAALAVSPATGSFTVTATVANLCVISVTNMAFGTYTPTAASQATATVTSTCSNGDTDVLSLSTGSGSYTQRTMLSGAVALNYNLYKDSGYTTVWTSTSPGGTVSLTGTGAPQTTTIYGQVPAGQYIAAGSYTDTITASLTY
jgi:spore coat protein U-like protein